MAKNLNSYRTENYLSDFSEYQNIHKHFVCIKSEFQADNNTLSKEN